MNAVYFIVILGAGYAGLLGALRLRRMKETFRIALINASDQFLERVRLQESIVTAVTPRSGVVGCNVQVAVDTEHHLIVAHEVTNSGSDRARLANKAKQGVLKTETLEAVADRGYFSSPESVARMLDRV